MSGSGNSWAICKLTQTHNHASIPPLKFFTGRMPFLPPNQQHQSTEKALSETERRNQSASNSLHFLVPQVTKGSTVRWMAWQGAFLGKVNQLREQPGLTGPLQPKEFKDRQNIGRTIPARVTTMAPHLWDKMETQSSYYGAKQHGRDWNLENQRTPTRQ